jgi:lipopolysaccharide export system protein LptA
MKGLAGMTVGHSRRHWPLLCACAGLLSICACTVSGQVSSFGKGKNFKVALESYPPPNGQQIKSFLQGAEAEPQAGGRVVIRQARLQTFKVTGEPELLVETPECVYDSAAIQIHSAGALKVQTGDGRFLLEGRGWLWQQTNSSLAISNDVRTVLKPEALANPATQVPVSDPGFPPREINIFADRFFYGADAGDGVFGGNVRVAGTNLSLTSEQLSFKLPMGAREIKSIGADGHVQIDYSGIKAGGERAVYSAETGLATITGDPVWSAPQGEGRARELLIDYTNRVFTASGDAIASLQAQSLGAGGFFGSSQKHRTAIPAPTNHLVEIRSDFYQLRTNLAVFGDTVRVRDLVGDAVQGTMDCRSLEVTFVGTNELQRMVALKDVVIAQATNRFTGGKAVYTATNGVLLITEDPAWQSELRQGKGDVISVNLAEELVEVLGNASMRLPADDLAQSSLPGQRPSAAPPTAAGGKFADIFARQYRVDRKRAQFVGGVYISHPQMAWASENLTVYLPAGGGRIEQINAEQAVAFDLVDEFGRKVKGRGERAVYRYNVVRGVTNNLVELTGNPVLETTNGVFFGQRIILDLGNGRLIAPASYRIRGTVPGGATNAFELPKVPSIAPPRDRKKK